MGKRRYEKSEVSKTKTAELDIKGLLVIETDDTDRFCAIRKSYFKKQDKPRCPACGSTSTRVNGSMLCVIGWAYNNYSLA